MRKVHALRFVIAGAQLPKALAGTNRNVRTPGRPDSTSGSPAVLRSRSDARKCYLE